ncbi:DUF4214 domain-containing protein, partial [Undibacterium sp.]|uniref:DUF4214 domain-containing protein n=1 Tax=Undibacterium sp. TaxID=1914977 RepID=UPI003751AD7D
EVDWKKQTLKFEADAEILRGIVKSSLDFESDFNMNFEAKGSARVKVAGIKIEGNFFVHFSNDGKASNDYIAVWAKLPVVGTVGLKTYFDGDTSTFGKKSVDLYKSWIVDSTIKDLAVQATWENEVVGPNLTRVVIYSDLAKTVVSQVIEEADYAAHGITVISELSDATHKFVFISNTRPAVYDLEFVNPEKMGKITFEASTTLAPMSLEVDTAAINSGVLDVSFRAAAENPDAVVRFYADTDNVGFNGLPIGTAVSNIRDGQFRFDTNTLAPGNYYIYGILEDGQAIPMFDYAATPITVAGYSNIVSSIQSPDTVLPNEAFMLVYTLTNTGQRTSNNIDLAAILPAGISIIDSSVTIKSTDASGHHFQIDRLDPGQTAQVKLMMVATAAGQFDFSTLAYSRTPDAEPDNNIAKKTIIANNFGSLTSLPSVLIGDTSVQEGSILVKTIDSAFGVAGSLSATLMDGSALPTWLKFDPVAGLFTGTPEQADVGAIQVKVNASSIYNAPVSDNFWIRVGNVNNVPTGGLSVSGDLSEGKTLSINNTITDQDGLGELIFKWLADGKIIPNMTGSSLALTPELTGKAITASATYVDKFGTLESVTAPLTDTISKLIGDAANDQLFGTKNNDVFDGGLGFDTVNFKGKLSDFKITRDGAGFQIQNLKGTEGLDKIMNAEALKFEDLSVNLTIKSNAASIPEATLDRIIELYVGFFNRVPDADGLNYWINQNKAGMSITQIANSFFEAGAQYTAQTGYSANMSSTDFVNTIYKNVFGRSAGADAEGLNYWKAGLDSGKETHGSLMVTMLDSAHRFKGDAQWGWVANLLDNKISVGEIYAVNLGLTENVATDAITKGISILQAVTPTDYTAALQLIGVTELNISLI